MRICMRKLNLSSNNLLNRVFCLGVVLSIISCGQDQPEESQKTTPDLSEEQKFPVDEFFLSEFSLVAASGEVRITRDTQIKDDKGKVICSVRSGTTIPFKFISKRGGVDRAIVVADNQRVCNSLVGSKKVVVLEQNIAVFYKTSYSLTTKNSTIFKVSTAQSSALDSREKCSVKAGEKLYIKKAAIYAASKTHVKVELENSLSNCSFKVGYFYVPHLSNISFDDADQDSNFPKVMKHILLWEGGCSDHPNDPGGRTFMGITTGRAKQNGWTADVCTMPKSMVLDIYKKDYWDTRPKNYGWPLNLAVMNTEVNSGGGRAAQFLRRMQSQQIGGSLTEQASWFVDQQTDFYYIIADNNPKLRVFLRGWTNRSNYMQDVIAGDISLQDNYGFEPTASSNLD